MQEWRVVKKMKFIMRDGLINKKIKFNRVNNKECRWIRFSKSVNSNPVVNKVNTSTTTIKAPMVHNFWPKHPKFLNNKQNYSNNFKSTPNTLSLTLLPMSLAILISLTMHHCILVSECLSVSLQCPSVMTWTQYKDQLTRFLDALDAEHTWTTTMR